MSPICLLLAGAALVPWPKEVRFTGGSVNAAEVHYATDAKLPREGYRLSVSKKGVKVWSSTRAGRFYADQTLRQLNENGKYACCEIVDEPRFAYRGFHLDVARHFFDKAAVKKLIDEMSRLKFNAFHWHFADDQGWRIQLKKYPELTEYGSWRVSSPVFGKMWQRQYDGVKYGPYFYTEEEAREIVAYAAARHVAVIPEIDIPGHCQGLLAGYPWMLCEGQKLNPRCARNNWWLAGIRTLCIGNDDALRQVEGIIDELCKIFPGEYFHFGGDECPDRYWAGCPKCKTLMEKEGLSKPHELQPWFTERFAKYLISKGRKPIGWDEILGAPNLPQETIIMSWRGINGGVAAARRGNGAILAPAYWCNLNRWDGNPGLSEFTTASGLEGGEGQTLETVYSFDPLKDVPLEARKNVLGGQCCCWSEFVFSDKQMEWRFFPRAGAIAEALWTAPAARDYPRFRQRLSSVRKKMAERGVCVSEIIDYARLSLAPKGKIRVAWGGDSAQFSVPANKKSHRRMDVIVRSKDGKLVYRAGYDGEKERAAGLLAGAVWVPAKGAVLTADDLYDCRSCRPYIRRCLWNSPLASSFAPKTLSKLRSGSPVNIVALDDGFSGNWAKRFAERLAAQYAKAKIALVKNSDVSFDKIASAGPDLVVSVLVGETKASVDAEELEKTLAERNALLSAKGIEWIICQPHFVKSEWMGCKTARACMKSDTRRASVVLRKFAAQHKVGLADTAKYWSQLGEMAIPYESLLKADGVHVTEKGAAFTVEALMDLFEEFE